jgi:hypothetical protein
MRKAEIPNKRYHVYRSEYAREQLEGLVNHGNKSARQIHRRASLAAAQTRDEDIAAI